MKDEDDNKPTEEELAIQRGDIVDEEELAKAAAEDDEAADDDGDGAAEGDGDAELEAAAELEEDDVKAKDEDVRIPKARLDEVLTKSKEAAAEYQRQIDELNAQVGSAKVTEDIKVIRAGIEELEDKYEALVTDGELVEAKQVRRDLNYRREQLMDAKAAAMGEAARDAAVNTLTYKQTLARYEGLHPAINPDSDGFDQLVLSEVATVKQAFQNSGLTPAAALDKAVRYVLPSPAKVVDVNKLKDEKNKATRVANSKTDAGAPPNLNRAGKASNAAGPGVDGLNPLRMSEKQFAALTDDQLKKLRGDVM